MEGQVFFQDHPIWAFQLQQRKPPGDARAEASSDCDWRSAPSSRCSSGSDPKARHTRPVPASSRSGVGQPATTSVPCGTYRQLCQEEAKPR
mmetsp:Transcript_65148/g.153367  ORF Transcript_65148/g.153367 Transcript_65148/m.153367 type:complete len:91 (+) Transcript_65148:266-538(+)